MTGLFRRLRARIRNRRFEEDLREELRFHEEMKREEVERLGIPADEARPGTGPPRPPRSRHPRHRRLWRRGRVGLFTARTRLRRLPSRSSTHRTTISSAKNHACSPTPACHSGSVPYRTTRTRTYRA